MRPGEPDAAPEDFDRHRRRVLWALPTGLYLIGSRHGDEVNLMTANLVVQVCMEPKLVGVALERDSVTARLVSDGGAFAVSLLNRGERDLVRRFVKPVTDVERSPEGVVVAMAGLPVTEVGPTRVPVLGSAAGYLVCTLTNAESLGSHTLCIGEVTDVGGEPTEVLRMEDTRMHYGGYSRRDHTPRRAGVLARASVRRARGGPVGAGLRRPQVDAQRQDAVDQLSFGVTDHGEVRVVALSLFAEALALGTLDGRHAALRTALARCRKRATISLGRRPSRRPA